MAYSPFQIVFSIFLLFFLVRLCKMDLLLILVLPIFCIEFSSWLSFLFLCLLYFNLIFFSRNIFTQVDRAHRKFSDEQIKNLGIITRLYEGDNTEFWTLVEEYKKAGKHEQVDWLLERWPEGIYKDIIGLCKVAKLEGEDGIIDQDYSLNAGRYVGVVIEDDGMTEEEFAKTMKANHAELKALNAEAETLMAEIEKNIKELFG